MSKIKQYIDLMTPMEAYEKGREDAQEAVYSESVTKRLSAQAPVPFGAGKKAGIKKVVEWITAHADRNFPTNDMRVPEECHVSTLEFYEDEWQARLKKWGIKNDN